jgi:serine protease Do
MENLEQPVSQPSPVAPVTLERTPLWKERTFWVGMAGALALNVILALIFAAFVSSPNGKEALATALGVEPASQAPVVDSAGDRSDVVNVVEDANPAVVSIVITKDVPIIEQYYQQNPFGDFFGLPFGIPQYRQNGTQKQEVGGGSGFLISSDGYIVTNAHVVADKDADYTVLLNDGTKYDAQVVAADTTLDVALIKISATDELPYLEFGDSSAVKVGQSVIAIGNALGEFRNTVSVGVVSGLSRSITAGDNQGSSEQLTDIIQTDAAINPGNSGGPLLDLSGQVIGINVAASIGSAENIGFALPANSVKTAVESMKEHGRVIRPYLGVRFIPVTESLKESNDLSVDYGALIVRGDNRNELAVIPGSPADKAGLEENDIILKIDGQKIDEDHPLQVELQRKAVGDLVDLQVLHDGEEETVAVKLTEAPQE